MISKEMCRQGAYRLRRVATPMAGLALLGALFASGAVPAFAAGGATAPSPAGPGTSAPVVVAPSSPKPAAPAHVRTGDVPKPAGGVHTNVPASPETASWTLSLSVYPTAVLVGNATNLTATTNQDVGPTPYWIQIYDNTGRRLVACGSGTSCTTTDSSAAPTTRRYLAVVSYYATSWPGFYNPYQNNEQAFQYSGYVTWQSASVTLTANGTTVPTGTAVTLNAHTSFDVGPTPYWTEIFDNNTGARIAVCGGGTDCTVTVSYSSSAAHRYVAYISNNDPSYPPAGRLAVSASSEPWVTWTTSTLRVVSLVSSGYSVTATANTDVGPTPYWIEIFSETRGADGLDTTYSRLAACGYGTTCSASVSPGTVVTAFISPYSTALPPGVIASSGSLQF